MKKIITSLIVIISVSSASAGELLKLNKKIKKIEVAQQVCLDSEEGMTTLGMAGCFVDSFESFDNMLNAEYSKVVKNFKRPTGDKTEDESNKEQLQLLINSQRDWVKFRDSNSSFSMVSNYGGSLSRLDYISKKADMTKNRLIEITQIIYGYDGQ